MICYVSSGILTLLLPTPLILHCTHLLYTCTADVAHIPSVSVAVLHSLVVKPLHVVALHRFVAGCATVLPVRKWSGRHQPVAHQCSDLSSCLVICLATHSATKGCHDCRRIVL